MRDSICEILSPIESFGEAVTAYLAASISHHGRPERTFGDGETAGYDPAWFAPIRNLDPLVGMARLVDLTRAWCPRAFEPGPPEATLPDDPAVQHFFAGVVMLGDWLGSDTKVFAYVEDRDDPMPRARARATRIVAARFLATEGLRPACRTEFDVFDTPDRKFVPRAAQVAVSALPVPAANRASLTVLEAETGSGKTEAAIHRFAQLFHWKRSPGSAAKRSRVARSREDGDERARRRVSEGGRVVSVGWERATRSLDRCASTCR
jgi:CRISPR-associated endonuclease/helicase Cas3